MIPGRENLYDKKTHYKVKRQATDWVLFITNTTNKGLVSRIYKELISIRTRNNLIEKWESIINRL